MTNRKLGGPAIKIAVSSRKGGPGKSTLIGNLGLVLSLQGYRVLVCEVDDSPYLYRIWVKGRVRGEVLDDNLTSYRIFKAPGRAFLSAVCTINLADALARAPIHSKSLIADVRQAYGWTNPGVLELIPGTIKLRDVEAEYAVRHANDPSFDVNFQLREAFRQVEDDYDFILFDTPPSLAVIQRNVLALVHAVFIPVVVKATGLDDYDTTMDVIQMVQNLCERRNLAAPEVLGVVYNMYQPIAAGGLRTQEEIYQRFTQQHLDADTGSMEPPEIDSPTLATVRYDADQYLDAAIAARFPVPIYAPKSAITQDLIAFTQSVLRALNVAA